MEILGQQREIVAEQTAFAPVEPRMRYEEGRREGASVRDPTGQEGLVLVNDGTGLCLVYGEVGWRDAPVLACKVVAAVEGKRRGGFFFSDVPLGAT